MAACSFFVLLDETAAWGDPARNATESERCIERTTKLLRRGDNPRTYLTRAVCEEALGRLTEAKADAREAADLATALHDLALARGARIRLRAIEAKIRLAPQPSASARLEQDATDAASSSQDDSQPLTEGDHEPPPDKARGEEAPAEPAPSATFASSVDVQATLDLGGYTDTNHVDVLSPSVSGAVSSPTAGWHLSGSYLVDIVSAASPDIVSEASPPFREVRHAGTLAGGYKPGRFGADVDAHVSSEPDYLSLGGGVAVLADSPDKLISPRLALDFSHDTIGRGSTPFSVFHHDLDTLELEAGCTFVLTASSVLLVGGTVEFERGDQSKPYRYVPLFDPATATRVSPGQSIASVNAARESIRPLEQLPTARNRYAIGARFLHRFSASTLRIEERLFLDSWQQSATTTDLRHMFDVSSWLRVWPHLRFHAQTGANFYRLAYSPVLDPAGNQLAVPTYRTDDRELGPLFTLTGGGGVRALLSPPTSDTRIALKLEGDVMYSHYPLALFITSRTAVYATFGVEAELE